jgi:hypothetical protein
MLVGAYDAHSPRGGGGVQSLVVVSCGCPVVAVAGPARARSCAGESTNLLAHDVMCPTPCIRALAMPGVCI